MGGAKAQILGEKFGIPSIGYNPAYPLTNQPVLGERTASITVRTSLDPVSMVQAFGPKHGANHTFMVIPSIDLKTAHDANNFIPDGYQTSGLDAEPDMDLLNKALSEGVARRSSAASIRDMIHRPVEGQSFTDYMVDFQFGKVPPYDSPDRGIVIVDGKPRLKGKWNISNWPQLNQWIQTGGSLTRQEFKVISQQAKGLVAEAGSDIMPKADLDAWYKKSVEHAHKTFVAKHEAAFKAEQRERHEILRSQARTISVDPNDNRPVSSNEWHARRQHLNQAWEKFKKPLKRARDQLVDVLQQPARARTQMKMRRAESEFANLLKDRMDLATSSEPFVRKFAFHEYLTGEPKLTYEEIQSFENADSGERAASLLRENVPGADEAQVKRLTNKLSRENLTREQYVQTSQELNSAADRIRRRASAIEADKVAERKAEKAATEAVERARVKSIADLTADAMEQNTYNATESNIRKMMTEAKGMEYYSNDFQNITNSIERARRQLRDMDNIKAAKESRRSEAKPSIEMPNPDRFGIRSLNHQQLNARKSMLVDKSTDLSLSDAQYNESTDEINDILQEQDKRSRRDNEEIRKQRSSEEIHNAEAKNLEIRNRLVADINRVHDSYDALEDTNNEEYLRSQPEVDRLVSKRQELKSQAEKLRAFVDRATTIPESRERVSVLHEHYKKIGRVATQIAILRPHESHLCQNSPSLKTPIKSPTGNIDESPMKRVILETPSAANTTQPNAPTQDRTLIMDVDGLTSERNEYGQWQRRDDLRAKLAFSPKQTKAFRAAQRRRNVDVRKTVPEFQKQTERADLLSMLDVAIDKKDLLSRLTMGTKESPAPVRDPQELIRDMTIRGTSRKMIRDISREPESKTMEQLSEELGERSMKYKGLRQFSRVITQQIHRAVAPVILADVIEGVHNTQKIQTLEQLGQNAWHARQQTAENGFIHPYIENDARLRNFHTSEDVRLGYALKNTELVHNGFKDVMYDNLANNFSKQGLKSHVGGLASGLLAGYGASKALDLINPDINTSTNEFAIGGRDILTGGLAGAGSNLLSKGMARLGMIGAGGLALLPEMAAGATGFLVADVAERGISWVADKAGASRNTSHALGSVLGNAVGGAAAGALAGGSVGWIPGALVGAGMGALWGLASYFMNREDDSQHVPSYDPYYKY